MHMRRRSLRRPSAPPYLLPSRHRPASKPSRLLHTGARDLAHAKAMSAVAALTLRPFETVLAPYLRHPGAVAFGALRSLARQPLLSGALVMVALACCRHGSDVRTMRPRTDSRVIAAWRSRVALRGPQQALAARGKADEAARTQQEFEAAWTRAHTWLPAARVRPGARESRR